MKNALIETLQALGFTEYEAKTYLTLLEKAPLSAYAVARLSGVPRSRIYEVLEGMVGRGTVLASYGAPTQYAPLPPQELIALHRRATETTLEAAEQGLKRYATATASRDLIWDIAGRDEIIERVREVVGLLADLLHIWAEDAPVMREALSKAAARGVEVIVIAYGEPDYPFAHVYHHEMTDEFTRGEGGRWIILSADQQEIVTGIVSLGSASRAAWSSHPGLVTPVTEQAKHDLYIMEMLARHRDVLEASFGPGLVRLREQFGPTTIVAQMQQALGTPPE